jgi:hypothetical protein
MTQTIKRILFTTMALIVLLTACLPQQQATQDPAEVANQVATAVALTISAAQAQTQAAQPLPTNTTLPTQTDSAPPSATPIIPSATPFVIVPLTSTVAPSGGGGGGGGAPAPLPGWDCTPINNQPRDNTVFKSGNEFDIKWTIKNTGTKTIPAKLDVKYFSGPIMMKVPTDTFRELPEIKPGETAVIIIDAVAPAEKGFHVMTWRVEGNPTPCAPYVAIIVE